LRKRWTHFRKPDFADYAPNPRSQPGDPANDGRVSYAWEGPAAGDPSQLAAIWWGHPNEPDLMVIYNENWTPFTVTNLGDWSQQPWKVLARSWEPSGQDLCALRIGRPVRTPVRPSLSREDPWRFSPLQGDFTSTPQCNGRRACAHGFRSGPTRGSASGFFRRLGERCPRRLVTEATERTFLVAEVVRTTQVFAAVRFSDSMNSAARDPIASRQSDDDRISIS
jgi:hypothetical protein